MIIRKLTPEHLDLSKYRYLLAEFSNKILVLFFLFCLNLILFTPASVSAQEVFGGSCAANGNPEHYFDCKAINPGYGDVKLWSEVVMGTENCQGSDYSIHPRCSGPFATEGTDNFICGRDSNGRPYENCCVPCLYDDPDEEPLPDVYHGDACEIGVRDRCQGGTVCQEGPDGSNICLYPPGEQGVTQPCLITQECDSSSVTNIHEYIECREGICQELKQACTTDKQCEEWTGNEPGSIYCEGGVCQLNTLSNLAPGTRFDYCAQVPGRIGENEVEEGSQYEECLDCMGKYDSRISRYSNEGKKIFTAIGCIKVDGKGFAEDLIKILLGIAGMAALLSILAASFIYTTSRGDSGKIKEAKDLITSAVSGLLFIIFSVIILEYIGVQVLHIPGLGDGGKSETTSPVTPPAAKPLAYSVSEGGACSRDIECKRMDALSCEGGVCTKTMDRLAIGSVPLGGECYLNEHCISSTQVNDPENPGIEYSGSVRCENNQCILKFVGITPCADKADKDGYCQDLLDNSRAHCIENVEWKSLCSVPWQDPEVVQCNVTNSPVKAYTTEPNYCNESMNSLTDKYECFTPPGGTAGYCREK